MSDLLFPLHGREKHVFMHNYKPNGDGFSRLKTLENINKNIERI